MWFKTLDTAQRDRVTWVIVAFLCLVSIGLRYRFIANYNITFWYDQARDAIVAHQMIHDQDWKIQGPSASGTNDTVFHGVLYYYFILPWYALSQGDPLLPTFMLGVAAVALGFPAIYLLAYSFSRSRRVGLATVLLTAFSTQHIGFSLTFTNPTLALAFIPLFYLSIWQLFFAGVHQKRYVILLAFSLGMMIQSALWFLPVSLVVLLAIYYAYSQDKKSFKHLVSVTNIMLFGGVMFLTLFSIFFVQLRMITNGIFTLSKVAQGGQAHLNPDYLALVNFAEMYLRKVTESFFPSQPLLLVLLMPVVILGRRYISKAQGTFLILMLSFPIIIGAFQPRKNDYFFLGIEILLYLLVTFLVLKIKVPLKVPALILVATLFFFSNFQQSMYLLATHSSIIEYPADRSFQSNFLDEMELVDATYQIAQGQPFSISSLGNPYKYNTVWSYVYSWYGQRKYGYVPSYVGDTQAGLVNENWLPEVSKPLPLHFSIIQANNSVGENYLLDFNSVQSGLARTPVASQYFGKNILNTHHTTKVE